jgi:tetratricopeptide (TPR) repeat protein
LRKNNLKKIIYIFVFLVINKFCFGQLTPKQEKQIDSLKQVIKIAKHDSTIINAWKVWIEIIYYTDSELEFKLNKKIDSICSINLKKQLNKKGKANFLKEKGAALNNIGIYYHIQGDYEKAIAYYTKSMKIREGIEDKKGIAGSLNNIGMIYDYQGDYAKAIDYYSQSLKIEEEIGDKEGIASSLTNIGSIYFSQKDYAKAIEYYSKSLKIEKQIDDKKGMASSLNNIGGVYHAKGEFDKALEYYFKSLKIKEEIGDKPRAAYSLNNIGLVYHDQKDFAKAIDYFSQSLKIYEEIGDKQGMAGTLGNIGINYLDQGNYSKALDYGSGALSIAQELDLLLEIKNATQILWKTYKALGRYNEALSMYELYITTSESIESEENQKEVIRQEYKYEYEKQAATDSIKSMEEKKVKDAEIAKQDAEIKVKNNQQWMLFGGLALVIIFAGFIFNRFRITQKQKNVIEEQKHIVEEKNKEITDSITYAKRIQSAILPPHKIVKEYLPHSFILYKPKDIVAGDFYWMENINNKILFAACDCTGHGVPGAMVSVVCNNGLNRSVREYGLSDPGKILDKTREIVIQEFEKSEEEVKDGMDISFCSLDIENFKLNWAGANNPLWLIRNNELIEYKANKQPIGKYSEPKPFTTHEINLQKGDSIYIFTDGFSDQFGGEKGKKFKSSKFKELLLSIIDKSMEEQKTMIDEAFRTWTGALEQNDDVCVIGVRI